MPLVELEPVTVEDDKARVEHFNHHINNYLPFKIQ
jgi:hypothetical protein